MNFLCPACRTPLPRATPEHVTCSGCGVAVDLTRVDTAPGQARLWPEIDLSGETLSGYSLLKLLGSGGMGSVYEARGADGVVVALKVLSPLLAAEPALRERFRREARALFAISHPGVVKMLGEGEENGFCWYAMERVSGSDLRERLKSGPLTADEVRALGAVMFDALQVVHAAGFVHRDVKPSNILLAPEGPKLCDFGIARLEGSSTLTESAALLGSLRYMAPEQRWGKSDARSDLYAVGVVLHEALALGVPGEKPLPPSTPASLTRLIAKLTEQSPALRPQSAEAAKRMLLPSSNVPALLAASALVALLVGVGVFLLREDPPSPELSGTPLPLVATPDASVTSTESIDAGTLLAAAIIDAGADEPTEPPDAGVLSAAEGPKGLTAALETIRSTGTLGTKGDFSVKSLRGGKKPIAKPTKGDPPPLPEPTGKKKVSKAPTPEVLLEDTSQGTLSVSGKGAARVYDGNELLGDAPGDFRIRLGGHGITIICKVGDKREMRKVGLSEKSPSTRISYECPES